jgi:hypothetical protein
MSSFPGSGTIDHFNVVHSHHGDIFQDGQDVRRSFLFFLVGSKVILAVIAGKSRTFLKGSIYIWIMRMLGILLFLFSFFLFRDGLKLLGLF